MKRVAVLIYGAGDAGLMVARELMRNSAEYYPVGFIDDDPEKQTSSPLNLPVFGGCEKVIAAIEQNDIARFIIALPSVHTERINSTATLVLSRFPDISLQILPPVSRYFTSPILTELEEGRFAELISRDETEFDYGALKKYYSNKTVIVTGAGGSIGSEICRMLLRLDIAHLVCVGRGENSLYLLKQKLDQFETQNVEYIIADIKSRPSLLALLSRFPGAMLVHAAAHKHVPFMEGNIHEAVLNNICGTLNVLEAAKTTQISSLVFISTDKAVHPTSIMGKTKRICERLVASFNCGAFSSSSVRFGNVLGSRGSVIPLFARQIEEGGPLTVTHPEIRRYFMTIPEAAMLVLNSALYSFGGDISILDMGKQYPLVYIARRLIELSGRVPDKDIHIEFCGLRPGEKMYEELSYPFEELQSTGHPKISRISASDISFSEEELGGLQDLEHKLFSLSEDKLASVLDSLLYHPSVLSK